MAELVETMLSRRLSEYDNGWKKNVVLATKTKDLSLAHKYKVVNWAEGMIREVDRALNSPTFCRWSYLPVNGRGTVRLTLFIAPESRLVMLRRFI